MSTNRKYIVELSVDSVEIIAQLLHIMMVVQADDERTKQALKEFVDQTDIVSFQSKTHLVGPFAASHPLGKFFPPISYIPLKTIKRETS